MAKPARASVTAAIIAKDAERHLPDCLRSVDWADETLVVVDESSSDRTLQLANTLAKRAVISKFINYSQQRNVALNHARSDWVLFVDADERVGEELRDEIIERIQIPQNPFAAYWIPRRNIFFGNWIRHSGWYPDYQLRLLQRDHAHYDERRAVHELPQIDGPTTYLHHALIHYNYDNLKQSVTRQKRYAAAEATMLHAYGIRPRWHSFIGQPLREFHRRYITCRGYRDGWPGLMLAALMTYYKFLAYTQLRQLWRSGTNKAAT